MLLKVRLLMRYGIEDSDGKHISYRYQTTIAYMALPDGSYPTPEIIGGEWLEQEAERE